MVRYHDLVFQPDMLTARRDDGTKLRFTRQERALLLRLSGQPGTLVSRAQLLSALGDETGTLSERNVDYIVNRLRRRLGDKARSPRFIATQYGEGYTWIADPAEPDSLSAFLVVGPVYGLTADQPHIRALLERLAGAIRKAIPADRRVVLEPQWQPGGNDGDDIAWSLGVSAHSEDGNVHLALMLCDEPRHRTIRNLRSTQPLGNGSARIDDLARSLVQALWQHEALPTNPDAEFTDRPAHLRMHDAAAMLTDNTVSWRENALRLEQAHEADGSDARRAIMLALNRYARLLQSLGETDPPLDDGAWQAIETEIEMLALNALPDVDDDPLLLLAIAKLLRFIDRDYLDLADRLTERAFRETTAFAAAFSMKAQITASYGNLDAAGELYDKAIELAERGSQFHIYLLVLRLNAMMAGERRGEVEHLAVRIRDLVPASRSAFALFYVSPKAKALQPEVEDAFAALSPARGRHMTAYLFRISARQFRRKTHQRNILKGLSTHLVRHHGADAVAPIVGARFPELLGAGR